MAEHSDKITLSLIIILAAGGLFIFASAALGLLAGTGARFSSIVFSQTLFGIGFGSAACFITSRINYRFWRRNAMPVFLISVALTALVFLPGIGFEYGGARRWLSLGPFSLQPAELLKFGFVAILASWLAHARGGIRTLRFGLLPLFLLLGIAAGLLLSQPDTDSFFILFLTGIILFFTAGGKIFHIGLIGFCGAAAGAALVAARPYLLERIATFLNPASDPLGASYQIQQSLIAIGSGGLMGRGFGQSVQKFDYLPEPIGDSIFAVAAEEFGFIGAALIIALFLILLLRGLRIATHAPDAFGGLLAEGIVILITVSAFMNIGSMLGIVPLSGLPLPFVSHGGSALFFTLAEAGVLLNISRYRRA